MKQYFEEMIKDSKPITQDVINRMTQARMDKLPRLVIDETNVKPRSSYGTIMEVGDIVLYFIEQTNDVLHIKSVLLKEIERLKDDYTYIVMDGKTPRFKKIKK